VIRLETLELAKSLVYPVQHLQDNTPMSHANWVLSKELQQLSQVCKSASQTICFVALEHLFQARHNAMLQASRKTVDSVEVSYSGKSWHLRLSNGERSVFHHTTSHGAAAWKMDLSLEEDGLIPLTSLQELRIKLGIVPLEAPSFGMMGAGAQFSRNLNFMFLKYDFTAEFVFQLFTESWEAINLEETLNGVDFFEWIRSLIELRGTNGTPPLFVRLLSVKLHLGVLRSILDSLNIDHAADDEDENDDDDDNNNNNEEPQDDPQEG
jgi:hypothetical protein